MEAAFAQTITKPTTSPQFKELSVELIKLQKKLPNLKKQKNHLPSYSPDLECSDF